MQFCDFIIEKFKRFIPKLYFDTLMSWYVCYCTCFCIVEFSNLGCPSWNFQNPSYNTLIFPSSPIPAKVFQSISKEVLVGITQVFIEKFFKIRLIIQNVLISTLFASKDFLSCTIQRYEAENLVNRTSQNAINQKALFPNRISKTWSYSCKYI